eukprot:scaffold1252_cov154-Amphora_coffeaeformis.AAC.10
MAYSSRETMMMIGQRRKKESVWSLMKKKKCTLRPPHAVILLSQIKKRRLQFVGEEFFCPEILARRDSHQAGKLVVPTSAR